MLILLRYSNYFFPILIGGFVVKVLYTDLAKDPIIYDDNVTLIPYSEEELFSKKLKKILFYKFSISSINFFISSDIKGNVKITLMKLIKMLELNKGGFLFLNGCHANLKMISNELGMKSKTLYNHIKILEKYEILKKVKSGRNITISINPFVIWYGGQMSKDFIMFKDSRWVIPYKKAKQKSNKR